MPALTFDFDGVPVAFADFRLLRTRFPYITMMPQAEFLRFITGEAARYPSFRLVMGASVRALIEEGGEVRGVRYRARDGLHEVRALLTVGADGRNEHHAVARQAPPAGDVVLLGRRSCLAPGGSRVGCRWMDGAPWKRRRRLYSMLMLGTRHVDFIDWS